MTSIFLCINVSSEKKYTLKGGNLLPNFSWLFRRETKPIFTEVPLGLEVY